jgi:hypothetical protein
MKPAENIKRLIKQSDVTISSISNSRILGDALIELEKLKTTTAATEPNIWKIIMKSKIAKFAIAAILIIAAIICFNHFGGSIDGASVAWGKMIENMKRLPWMHIIMESEQNSNKQRFEVWISFESQVSASKRSSGEIRYSDSQKHVEYRYDPSEKTIEISYFSEDITKGSASIVNFWETWLKQVTKFSTESITEAGKYNGRKAKIYKFKASQNELSYESMIIVDTSQNLPVFGHQKSFDSNGNLIKSKDLYFEYPEEGPTSIYDIGAPRNVKIIDNSPK